jgi:Ca2+-binding RTX toxin-like protein
MAGTIYDVANYIDNTINTSGLTIADGSHTFFKVKDGTGNWDYILQELDGTADFEGFYLSSRADTFSGDSGQNNVYSYEGNDTIYTQGGNDYVWAGSGLDTVYGGDGDDQIRGEGDNDILFGDAGADTLWGGASNDTLKGGTENDILYGEDGNDTLYSDAGVDYIDGGVNSVTDEGSDYLLFDGGTTRVVVNLSGASINYDATTLAANRLIDSYGNLETVVHIEHVVGTAYNDTFIGNTLDNTLDGGTAGNDYFYASLGNDYIQGGGNTDTMDFSVLTTQAGVSVDFNSQHNAVFKSSGGVDYVTTLFNIENFIGTAQNDTILGDSNVNILRGGAGDDTITALGGNDSLYGDAGNDTINGGAGNDIIDGGADNDTVSFVGVSSAVKVNLATSVQGGIAATQATGDGTDTLIGIENVIGGNSGDTIYGDGNTNTLSGGSGVDTLYGMAGVDTIYGDADGDTIDGGTGNDTLYGGTGDDIFVMASGDGDDYIDGEENSDIVDFSSYGSAINITMSSDFTMSIYGNDHILNVEGMKGSTVADSIVGDGNINILYGMAGNDTLKGMAGNDTLYGGNDNDTLSGGADDDYLNGEGGDDFVDYSGVATAMNVNLRTGVATGEGTDTLISIEHIKAGNGTNTLEGNSSNNSFIGGSGTDTLSYSGASGSVSVALSGSVTGADGSDTFTGIENFVGGGSADTFSHNAVWNGAIDGGAGIDIVDFSASSTVMTVTNATTIAGGGNTSTLTAIEVIKTGSGADTFNLSSTTGINTLDAGGGSDTLSLSGNLDLSTITLLNFEVLNVAAGQTLTIEASQLSGKTVTGTGTINALNLDAALTADFANVASGITLNVDWSGTATYTGNLTNVDGFTISSGTMTVTDDILGTLAVSGAGSIVVQVSGNSSQNFNTLGLSGTETIQFTGNSTFTGDFQNSRVSVDSGVTLTTDASLISGKTVIGTGNVAITNLDGTLGANFVNLASGLNVSATWDGSGTYTGNLTNVDSVTVASGTMTVDASIVNGKTITNNGTVAIVNLDGTAGANLSAITGGTITASTDGNVTFTGNLGSAVLTVGGGTTFTATASVVNGKTITNNGTVFVTDLDGTPAASLTGISGGTINATWDGTATFTGNIGNANLTVASGTMTVSSGTISGSGTVSVSSGATLSLDASKASGETISGAGTVSITNLDGTLNGNFANITATTVNATWDGTATYSGNLTNVDTVTIASGTMTIADSILGTVTVNGGGNLTVNADDTTVNLANVSSSLGTVTINDSTSGINITGTAGDDILNLSSGNDTVNLGAGNDTINVTIANLDINDNITDTGGADILNITTSGTIDSANLIDVSGIETLNLSSGDDTITFDDVTEFNNFRNEFTTDIVDAGGNDSLSFGSSAVSGDLDFSKLGEFENLNLSSVADSLTLSGDEPDNINGLGGNDTFTINFSNLVNFDFDGGSGTDTVSVNGTGTGATTDGADFGTVTSATFTNIETLDLTGLDFSGFGDDQEYLFTDALLDNWNGAGTDFTIRINAEDAENIKFTEQGGTVRDGNGTGDSGNTITTGDYDLGNTTLHIEIV